MTDPGRVLVVEDDAVLAELLVEELEAEGHQVRECRSAEDAVGILDEFEPEVVVSDLRLPGADGLALLEQVRRRHAAPALLMITAFGTVDRAVAALKAGADNFLTKPLDMDHFTLAVERLLANRRLRTEVRRFRELLDEETFHGLEGNSRSMRILFDHIRRVARADGPVLICGESGTGKELVARAIHAESSRRDRAFLAVNCAGVPSELLESEFFGHASGAFTGAEQARTGLFREANGGTLFLDEIGEMPAALQVKLLRALQDGRVRPVGADREHTVDVRVVAATNRDLARLVESGSFRADLYYRLETFQLDIPPLRERQDDLELLALRFLARYATARGRPVRRLKPQAMAPIRGYSWPGNVRELKNAMERAVTFCESEEMGPEHLPERVRKYRRDAAGTGEHDAIPSELLADGHMLPSLDELKARYVRYVLDRVNGNKRRAAALLGIGRRTLYRWLDERADASGAEDS